MLGLLADCSLQRFVCSCNKDIIIIIIIIINIITMIFGVTSRFVWPKNHGKILRMKRSISALCVCVCAVMSVSANALEVFLK